MVPHRRHRQARRRRRPIPHRPPQGPHHPGGFNVYPEIEEVLLTQPGIGLAAVASLRHPPGSTVTEEEIATWSKQNVAGHKYPRLIEFRHALPTTATGKILKHELTAMQQD
ncbi:hypothetical protein AB0M42_25460 [Streptomyces sp. NPDC051784]|uniref:AMP-binding enzyme n=1 Tax=Streptomyces sp. NPDC051784 TaxID=3155805 RepID=UPI00341D7D26